MNTLAKAFVVINLLLGVAFLSVSCVLFAQQEFWKQEHALVAKRLKETANEADQKIEKANEMIGSRERAITKLREEKGRQASDIEKLEADLGLANKKLAEQEAFKTRIETKLTSLDAGLKEEQTKNTALNSRFEKLKTDYEKASELKMLAEDTVVKRDEEIADLKLQNRTLTSKVNEQQKELSRLDAVIASLPPEIRIPEELKPLPPALDAVVEGVDNAGGIVILSVGIEDDVKKGHTFYIYRDDSFIGQVEIEDVLPSSSVARVNRGMTKADIEVGDGAKTLLGL